MFRIRAGAFFVIAWVIVASPLSEAQSTPSFDSAVKEYNRGNFTAAIGPLLAIAERGDAKAQNLLGVMYEKGEGVPVNLAQAAQWYRRAADQQYATAQNNLGWMYATGRGVTRSDVEAVQWYQRAAQQGESAGQANLGVMYEGGRGVSRSYAQARYWYQRAAEQGEAAGQTNLGRMYFQGRGGPESPVSACFWVTIASASGEPDAIRLREVIVRQLDREDVSSCDQRARVWKPTP
jgi:TPR repeat protein